MDDLFILYSHDDEFSLYNQFTVAMKNKWEVEDEGPVADLLNVEIERVDDSIVLKQTAYIDKLISIHLPDGPPFSVRANMAPCDKGLANRVHAAVESKVTPDGQLLSDYQSLVGALLYASTHTRPDIAYSVGQLTRCMAYPTPELLADARRVLAYLDLTRELGLTYEADKAPMRGYSDSDWAVKHSTSGWVFQLNQAAVAWGSKKQKSVSLSSCEAEIVAASEASKEAVYTSRFLTELGFPDAVSDQSGGARLDVDNKGAIDLAYNPQHHDRTKHIDRRHFYIRELVENGEIVVNYVNTVDNMADFFTKALEPKRFFALRNIIINVPPDPRATPPVPPLSSG